MAIIRAFAAPKTALAAEERKVSTITATASKPTNTGAKEAATEKKSTGIAGVTCPKPAGSARAERAAR